MKLRDGDRRDLKHPDWRNVKKPMTAEDKQQWIMALRSGKYRKARGKLATKRGHCCLGVANDEFSLGEHEGHNFLSYRFLPFNIQQVLASINDSSGGFDVVIEAIEMIEPYEAPR